MTAAAPLLSDPHELEAHRAALTGHCYRMLGSIVDADDAVQDTLVRAWRSLDRFDGRASLRTWLYRIATNVCLDALQKRGRRARPVEEGPPGTVEDELEERARTHWLEPVPDALAIPADADPAEAIMLRESIRLAFVAALQHLPPRQRAALLLTSVLGLSAAETADILDTSVPAVNSALQRARATLDERGGMQGESAPLDAAQTQLLERYVDAFHRYDTAALTALLTEDATMSMPPFTLWLTGPATIRRWLDGRGIGCKGSRLLATAASGAPAFGQYRPSPDGDHVPWSLVVLELSGPRIVNMTYFLDTETLFPRFELPPRLPPR